MIVDGILFLMQMTLYWMMKILNNRVSIIIVSYHCMHTLYTTVLAINVHAVQCISCGGSFVGI